jgi:hypothetical protein
MARSSPYRVTVPLSPQAYEAVTHLAEVQKISRGRVLADLLDPAVPAMVRLSSMLKKFEALQEDEKRHLDEVMSAGGEAFQAIFAALQAVEEGPQEGGSERRPAPSPPADRPPHTNRGVQGGD